MVNKKIPLRRCIATGEQCAKKDLIRIVRNKEGEVFIDLQGRQNGRGAYLKATLEAAEQTKNDAALVGTDTFQLGTCLFDQTKAYNDGDALYVTQSEAGQVEELDAIGVTGVNILTSEGEGDIVGYVVDGVINLQGNVAITAGNGIGTAPDGYNATAPVDTVFSGGPALWTEATPSKVMLKFTTKWVPAPAAAGNGEPAGEE